MANSSRFRKSSDEVRVEISDSDRSGQRYWNLREQKYDHRPRYQERDGAKHRNSGSNHHRRKKKCKARCSSCRCKSENRISIQFNMDEERQISQSQKQTILNTLIDEDRDQNSSQESRSPGYTDFIPENSLIPLIALLAFFAFFSLVVIAATGSHYHYY